MRANLSVQGFNFRRLRQIQPCHLPLGVCHRQIVEVSVDGNLAVRMNWFNLLRVGNAQLFLRQCDGADLDARFGENT